MVVLVVRLRQRAELSTCRPRVFAYCRRKPAFRLTAHAWRCASLGGTAQLLDDFPRVRLVDNPAPDRSTIHRRLQRLFQQRGIHLDALAAGDSFCLSRDVTANILFPPRSFGSPSLMIRRTLSTCWSGRRRRSCLCPIVASRPNKHCWPAT